ncbi:MAG: CBS domain-containing protein [Candidatus Methylopumilus sp.]|jgi:CBS domain-containing protein|nr:CBS domain-containing protein [Candidatus Methylopumilus sp.]NBW60623.1 CBS domain-containing protein [Methylophilaceae bacterium]
MKTARQLLAQKGNQTLSVEISASVYDALLTMAEHDVGALLVMNKGKLAGIFSERDYARSVILKGLSSKQTSITEVMSAKVITVSPDQTVEDCMNLMTDKRIRHLPVLDQGKLIGVLSIGDLVKETIAYQRFLIEQLEKYIQS